ncbi:MAG TPA: hypothetical protein VE954_24480 [Oligoflexus sp.]|uniref:hypothetical protein n=1 Tax=Oligoflexus sp. TaxID=1971216 RepID=UPI002D5CDCB7|nr:hypothetical protein [Oligoflexus sp.]HYX36273.1 hypothetical protein [Oligoflexus sp.]
MMLLEPWRESFQIRVHPSRQAHAIGPMAADDRVHIPISHQSPHRVVLYSGLVHGEATQRPGIEKVTHEFRGAWKSLEIVPYRQQVKPGIVQDLGGLLTKFLDFALKCRCMTPVFSKRKFSVIGYEIASQLLGGHETAFTLDASRCDIKVFQQSHEVDKRC